MPNELADVQLHRVDSLDDAMAFKRWLGERRPIMGLDTETTGLDTRNDRVRLVQFGDAYQGWTIRRSRWLGLIEETIEQYEGEYVLHNGPFDVMMLRNNCGIELPLDRCHDTLIMAHVLDSTRPNGLKPLATMNIDAQSGVAQKMLDKAFSDNGWDWATIPYHVPVYSVYAAMDTVLTARLYNLFMPQVQQVSPVAYDLEREFAWVVMNMRDKGAAVDVPFTEQAYDSFQTYVKDMTEWCEAQYSVSPGSNDKVIDRLAADGATFAKYTCGCWEGDDPCDGANHKQRYALDKEVLETLQGHPLASAVLARRRAQKLASTYLKNFVGLQQDGILRANMKSVGARTGRMSISEPALQTLPRRSEGNPLAITVRDCIVPREGNVLALCDFAQVELRVLAHLSRDPGLIGAFAGDDFFSVVARELYQDPSLIKSDPRRQLTKNAIYALSYGAGPAKIALTAGVPEADVRNFLQLLAMRFPGLKNLQNEVANLAFERKQTEGRGYITSPLTGRRHWADNGKEYALTNYLGQGTGAEILKIKATELDNAGLSQFMVLMVHDEVILDVPREQVREVSAEMNSIMNDDKLLSVPLEAETEYAYRWGQKGSVSLEEVALDG